ncbi:MAG: L-serine ammonia-lyase, iron-sulfur-dependent, subunit alpha [Firmicutes bacterium]|nr:L-serine ammonia-lyase, iron-sulfur-dependent, subunit alpha [Oscillospiraceae bacterium]MBS5433279.1 L-serine ammonia-lyase, iron-sulfur-dependent, subunit alpha [Bacillota bacterium]
MAVFDSVTELLAYCGNTSLPLWEAVMRCSARESGISAEESWEKMRGRLLVMEQADASYEPALRSRSGLSGGDAEKMQRQFQSGGSISGDFIGQILSSALRMSECNACMRRIVAAPTAGSCGVIPAVLLPYARRFQTGEDELVKALYVAAGFGSVIASRASISGAEAGCQAEVGSASAMAAAALVYLHGGREEQMANAAAIALKNMMGLVCDPVAGLVEVPCVKRNAAGAMNALTAAELALAGIESRIPPDEVIDAMQAVGEMMPAALRETGEGGIAASPTAIKFRQDFFGA